MTWQQKTAESNFWPIAPIPQDHPASPNNPLHSAGPKVARSPAVPGADHRSSILASSLSQAPKSPRKVSREGILPLLKPSNDRHHISSLSESTTSCAARKMAFAHSGQHAESNASDHHTGAALAIKGRSSLPGTDHVYLKAGSLGSQAFGRTLVHQL